MVLLLTLMYSLYPFVYYNDAFSFNETCPLVGGFRQTILSLQTCQISEELIIVKGLELILLVYLAQPE